MNNILSLLNGIPKDNNGFEDIDKFWEITEKLTYPLDIRVKSNLLHTKVPETIKSSHKSQKIDDSDNEFDYDTTASITDEEDNEFADSDNNLDDDENDDDDDDDSRRKSSMSVSSDAKTSKYTNKSYISIGLSPLDNNTTINNESLATSKQNESSIVNMTNQTKSSLSSLSKKSKGTARSTSTTPRSSSELQQQPSTTTSTPYQQNNSSSIFMNESLTLNDSHMDILNDATPGAILNDTGGRSSRRVSFGANTELGGQLSPIQLGGEDGNTSTRSSRVSRNSAPSYYDDDINEQDNTDFAPSNAEEEEEDDENASRIASQTSYTPRRSSTGGSSVKTPSSKSYTSTSGSSGEEELDESRVTMAISTPGSREFMRGYHLPDESYITTGTAGGATDNEDDEGELDTTLDTNADASRNNAAVSFEESNSFLDNSYLHTISNNNEKYVEGKKAIKQATKLQLNRLSKKHKIEDDDSDENDDDQSYNSDATDDEESQGLRRSSRATKGRRFAYWKGERPVYESGTMIGLLLANPTPLKPKQASKFGQQHLKKQKVKAKHNDDDNEEEDAEEEPIRLPKGIKYIDRKKFPDLLVWNDSTETETSMHIVRTTESVYPAMALPQTAQRPPGKDKVGYAAHYFNIPEVPGQVSGWISGFVSLPPQAIKDAEGVGKYAQVFFISECQDNALELGIAHPRIDEWDDVTAQRMLLRKGDSFYIPPGNIYRLENHSHTKSSMLYWTIIKPVEEESASVNTSNAVIMNNKTAYSNNVIIENDI